jgi:hypothetical protein
LILGFNDKQQLLTVVGSSLDTISLSHWSK